jgi:peptidoglycan/LPS O-acetylase OafA/YrhL
MNEGSHPPNLYIPALDGLRFIGFILVFFHHVAAVPDIYLLRLLQAKGWVGVEIFFVISAFLLFYLLDQEKIATGTINPIRFYFRRFLRIYPLMMLLPIAMLAFYGVDLLKLARFIGLAFFVDNFMAWGYGFNSIPFVSHLWTLSYEFQVYLLIPAGFALYGVVERKNFAKILIFTFFVALGARTAFSILAAPHPVVWVTPFLRPESVLVGVAVAIGFIRIPSYLAALALLISAIIFSVGPNIFDTGLWTIALYPICAVIAGSILILSMQSKSFSRILSLAPIGFLGKISFGLYVFHFGVIYLTSSALISAGVINADAPENYFARLSLSFVLTVLMAAASYYLYERPFLRIKMRFSDVVSRPI